MKKTIFYILLFLIPLTLSAQSSERELLIDNLRETGFNNNFPTFLLGTKLVGMSEEKPTGYNNLAYEMFLYNMFGEGLKETVETAYKDFTDEQLKEVNAFISSEAYKRINSKKIEQEAGLVCMVTIMANMSGAIGEPSGASAISAKNLNKLIIKNKEYSVLYDEYFNNVLPKEQLIDAMNKKINSLSKGNNKNLARVMEIMGVVDLLQPIMKLTTYKYVSLEQLKEVVAFCRTSIGKKLINAGNVYATNLNIDNKELEAKLADCMKNHTVEDLKKYIEIRKNLKFESLEPYRVITTVPYKKGTFTGETFYGVPEGYGTFVDKKGVKYTGTFNDGKMHGRIVIRKEGADSLVQMYALGKKMKKQSIGRNANGSVSLPPTYINTIGEDVAMGYGYTSSGDDKYIGFIVDGKLEGDGAQYTGTTEIKKGFFKEGKFVRGTQINIYGDGTADTIIGTQETHSLLNVINDAVYKTNNEDGSFVTYKGRMISKWYDGDGVYEKTYKDGKIVKYKGYYAYGNLYGYGEYYRIDGDKTFEVSYKGDFVANEYNGKGITTIKCKNEKSCSFNSGKFKFSASVTELTTVFDGEFKDGIFMKGKISLSTGDCFEGEFNDGVLINGTCKINANGKNTLMTSLLKVYTEDVYEGEIKDGKYNGKGILCREDYLGGKLDTYTKEGFFENGKFVEGTIKNSKGKVVKTIKNE